MFGGVNMSEGECSIIIHSEAHISIDRVVTSLVGHVRELWLNSASDACMLTIEHL